MDEHGQYVLDPSPETQSANPLSRVVSSIPEEGERDGDSERSRMQGRKEQARLPSVSTSGDRSIRDLHRRFMALNQEITDLQTQKFADIAAGKDIQGWIIVGRGVVDLPFTQELRNRTLEDIAWREVERSSHVLIRFWVPVVLLNILFAILSESDPHTGRGRSISSDTPRRLNCDFCPWVCIQLVDSSASGQF